MHEPLVQPLYWSHPKREEAYSYKNTFFFGSELLVCPITSARDKSTRRGKARAWLPPGRHIDLFSGIVYDGDRELFLHRTLEEYAVFAHEGSIIPMDAAEEPENGCVNPRDMEVKVVIGADGRFDMYEDNGHGSRPDEVEWSITPLHYKQSSGTVTIGPVSASSDAIPEERSWKVTFVALKNSTKPSVSVDGKEVSNITISTVPHGVEVQIPATSTTSKIVIDLNEKNPQLRITDPNPYMFAVLDTAQMLFDPKQPIWAIVSDPKLPLGVKVTTLQAHATLEYLEVVGALMELLCADGRSY